ncbi:multiheme c-type cytochrome [Puia dinghuensis]|uniref:multiheme c-type cytochrome n=1 Tax=Puia dinghuensis TaxID=1792502 RepID=UPI00166360BD|nr:multiheme c-type cytochrome [Puia dinghuensis]
MITFRKYHLAAGLIIIAICSLLSLENCFQGEKAPANASDQKLFAGSQNCVRCHRDIYEQHLQSFHHLTSAPANRQTLKGDFDSANKFYFNDHLLVAAEKKQDSFYQTAYSYGVPKLSRPFNIVVGSGKRGQTSIYWFQNYLFQLPLTYFTETNEWTISPGYSRKVDFNRSITSRCLECHSTYFQETTNKDSKADEFSKTNFILGVECEKCHGPGLEHIAFHEKNPGGKSGHAIFNPAKGSRRQSLDLCRLCHGGALSKSRPSFSFQPGDKLFDFFQQDTAKPVSEIDVHGNQYGMLAASKCFKNSEMTCLSCHDGHKNESMQAAQFYVKCETCHKSASHNTCKLTSTVSQDFLKTNCINCHMPEEASKAIMVIRKDESIPTSAHMLSHYIAVYKDISNQILSVKK